MAERPLRVPQPEFAIACAAAARAITASRPLEEIVAALDAAARLVLAYDDMGLWHADAADERLALVLGPSASPRRESTRPLRRGDHSPRLWPEPGRPPVCIGDASRELDAAYPLDRWLMEHDFPSVLALALGDVGRQLGALYFVARGTDRFNPEHAQVLTPLADLAALAVEHDQLRTFIAERQHRRKTLDALLKTLAEALDVRTIFAQMSDAVQPLLQHDHLALGLITDDGAGVKMHATSAGSFSGAPNFRLETDLGETFFQESLQWDFYIVRDVTVLSADRVRAVAWGPGQR